MAPELAQTVEWIASRALAARFEAADGPRSGAASLKDVEELLAMLEEAGVVAPAS